MSDRAAVTEQLLRERIRELESQGNANFLLSVLAIRDKLKAELATVEKFIEILQKDQKP
jgi:hypothetical protein